MIRWMRGVSIKEIKGVKNRVRFRSNHHTHQHTHCQHNFTNTLLMADKHNIPKWQDAQQLQALTRPHSMQNHTKKQHTESKHL